MGHSYYVVSIPTKPFLKQYLQGIYGAPLRFTTQNYFGMLIAAALEQRVYIDRSQEKINYKYFDVFSDRLDIHFPAYFGKKYNYALGCPKMKAIFVNKIIEERFEEDLYNFCQLKTQMSLTRKQAIELFCQQKNIEIPEQITYDNLKQMEYRHRKKLEKKVK